MLYMYEYGNLAWNSLTNSSNMKCLRAPHAYVKIPYIIRPQWNCKSENECFERYHPQDYRVFEWNETFSLPDEAYDENKDEDD